jgi:hypothetical protein
LNNFDVAMHNAKVHQKANMLAHYSDEELRRLSSIAHVAADVIHGKGMSELVAIFGFGMTYIDLELARREQAKVAN